MGLSQNEAPLTPAEFASAIKDFAPFETSPHIAVAVSGGADSMALAWVAAIWIRSVGGRMTALTVDHGLRADSAAEAALTGDRLRALGIDHEILVWQGTKPKSGVQAEARKVRYGLLENWCRQHGVLHLLAAHHADDQAETIMMRLARGSGPDGLAAMASLRELSACRLLRPLLNFPKARLIATLRTAGIAWVEDPSNVDPKYARTGLRARLADADVPGIIQAGQRFARARVALEVETARWLGCFASLSPAGYLTLERPALAAGAAEIRLRVLGRAVCVVGGDPYPPGIAAVERLEARLAVGGGATLGGARFDVTADRIAVFREARNLPQPQCLGAGTIRWDGRFDVMAGPEAAGLSLRPWSPEVAVEWPRKAWPAWLEKLPSRARVGVPIVERNGVYHAPQPGGAKIVGVSTRFRPTMPMAGGGFAVA